MLPAGTTSSRLRAKGVQSYGISVEGCGEFVEFVYRAVVGVAQGTDPATASKP